MSLCTFDECRNGLKTQMSPFNVLIQELAVFMAHICYQAGVLILKERSDEKTIVGINRSKVERLEGKIYLSTRLKLGLAEAGCWLVEALENSRARLRS